MENKIKLESKPTKNIKVRFGKHKGLIVKPYLSAEDITTANTNCVDQFLVEIKDKDITRYDLFPNVKIVFDLVVLAKCTNLEIAETFEVYDNLVSSGLVDFVTSKIKNYESAWNLILKSIELKNTFVGLNLVSNSIPNPKDLEKNIKQMANLVDEVNKKNPELINKAVENAITKEAMGKAKTELAEKKVKSNK